MGVVRGTHICSNQKGPQTWIKSVMGHQSSKRGNLSPFHASIKNRELVKHLNYNKIIVVYVTVDAVTTISVKTVEMIHLGKTERNLLMLLWAISLFIWFVSAHMQDIIIKKRWVENDDSCIDNHSSCSCYDVLCTAAIYTQTLSPQKFKQQENFLVKVEWHYFFYK